jgi:hypothetical protein
MEGIGKWLLILVAVYVAWRFLGGFLNQGSYNVQSSNYVNPVYPGVPYGYAGANFGVVGWGNQRAGYQGWNSGWHPRPRTGRPDSSTRW